MLLTDGTIDEAMRVAQRIRDSIPQQRTGSIGIATWNRCESPRRLVARADAALYQAKAAGRNRTVIGA